MPSGSDKQKRVSILGDVELKVNGREIVASEGETILEACENNDIYIPTLCRYIGLSEVGACRMCLVEVNGERLETACTTKVKEGMEIETDTEELWDHRRTILELIFSEENHYCMYCELEGDCELEEMFRRAGMKSVRFPLSYRKEKVDSSNQYITIDRNRCILCGRCIRACREKVCNDTLDFANRGLETKIIVDEDILLGDSSCISCGACAQVCPTGSIYESHSSFRGTEEDCDSTKSTCVECSMGCGIEVLSQSRNLVKINGIGEEPSGGQLCKKGRFEALDDGRPRVVNVLMKKNGRDIPVTLDEAMDKVLRVLDSADRINAVMSDRLPTETAKYFYKVMKEHESFFNVIGSEKKRLEDEIMRRLESRDVEISEGRFVDSVEEVLDADNILVYGTSIVETHPVFSSYIRRATKEGSRLITIDSDEDKLGRYSDISISLGSPESQLTGITLALLRENVDSLSDLSNFHLEDMNIDTSEVTQMASYLRKDGNNVIVVGPDIDDSQSLINIYVLSFMTDSKIVSLGSISNQAVYDLETETLDRFADVSYIFSADEDGQKLERMIGIAKNSDFVVVQAARSSQLTEMADIVLPALDWFERSGSFLDINGEEKKIGRVLEPRISIDSDMEVLEKLEGTDNND